MFERYESTVDMWVACFSQLKGVLSLERLFSMSVILVFRSCFHPLPLYSALVMWHVLILPSSARSGTQTSNFSSSFRNLAKYSGVWRIF